MTSTSTDQTQKPVALVTGGARRVGRAIVTQLANAGFNVVFTYLNSVSDARLLEDELLKTGGLACGVQADLTDPAKSSTAICERIETQFGRLSVLVNNASLYEASDLASATLEKSRRLWAIHVESPMLLAQRLAPLLRSSKGHIVNMLDLLAERPWPAYLPYCASKAGLWNLTLSLARELAPEVTVNGIAPGVVEWPPELPESDRQNYLRRVPLQRAGTSQEVARLVHFICTDGSYLTGQVIRLDGGRSIT
jgi:pteridine reductase